MASTIIYMPTKTRSGTTSKTHLKATTFDLVNPIKKNKLRKMVLLEVDEEEEEKNNLCSRRPIL